MWIGYIAALLALVAYLPQVYKSIQRNNFLELSALFLTLNLTACILFSIYSYINGEYPFFIVNSVCSICLAILLWGYMDAYYKLYPNVSVL